MKPSKKIEDSWLVIQYCNGNKKAMAVLVKRWHVIFCKHAYRYTNDVAIAKDIAQDAWITMMEKIDTIESPDKFGSWGISIVIKKSIDWYRKNKRVHEKQEEIRSKGHNPVEDEKDVVDTQSVKEKLKIAITSLSEEHQKVIKLFYIESHGIIEISKILDISKGTVKSRLYYAREKLKTILKD